MPPCRARAWRLALLPRARTDGATKDEAMAMAIHHLFPSRRDLALKGHGAWLAAAGLRLPKHRAPNNQPGVQIHVRVESLHGTWRANAFRLTALDNTCAHVFLKTR